MKNQKTQTRYMIKIDGINATDSNIDIVNSNFINLETLTDIYNLFHQIIFVDGFSTTAINALLNNNHNIQFYYNDKNINNYIDDFFYYSYNKNEIKEIEEDIIKAINEIN